jgi:hypothetical protein
MMRCRQLIYLGLCILVTAVRVAAQEGAQGMAEVVRGVVVGADSEAVASAEVTVTALRTGEVRTTHTNQRGEYAVLFGEGTGAYVVSVRAFGLARAIVRIVRPRGESGGQPVLESRIAMQRASQTLDTVKVVGGHGFGTDSAIGGNEQNAMQGALFSLDPSDLARLAARVPGVTLLPGMGSDSFSVRGVAPDQNDVRMDGLSTNAGVLPSDAIASASVTTTTFDATRGGFAGAQMSITTRKGSDLFEGSLSGTVSDTHLAWTDPSSLSPVPSRYTLNGSAGGPIKSGVLRYFTALQVGRGVNSLQSLNDPSTALLDRYGIGRDTVGRFATTLDQLSIPRRTSAIPNGQENNELSDFVRLDWLPTATSTLTTTILGSLTRNGGSGISPLAFSSVAGRNNTSAFGINSQAGLYVAGMLDELSMAFGRSKNAASPYVALPHGTVTVGSDFVDGRNGLTQLDFGGGTAGISRGTNDSWELMNALHWVPQRSRHAITLGQNLRVQRATSLNAQNPYGTFTFLSLDDLAANRPSSYSRLLSASERSTSELTGALSIDDKFKASRLLHLEYGLRVDLAHSGTIPAYNPVVDSVFARRTDFAPHDVGVSPRLGFDLDLGQLAKRNEWWHELRLSGGIGAFHGTVPPSRIASLVEATGLPDATRQLTCAGDATPHPDWALYASDPAQLPTSCLDGTAPVEFSSDRPTVSVFNRGFRAPTSWRGNLALSGLSIHQWRIDGNAELSREVNVEGRADLNLRRTSAFTLPAEGNRPVFASPDAIVPATGVIAPGASRVSDLFGAVSEVRSDLRTTASQIAITISPPHALFGRIVYGVQYARSAAQRQQRGFDGSTAGDPFKLEWAGSEQPLHQITLNASYSGRWGGLALLTRITSGLAYTPAVGGDINGDGLANDRAFIFDPATVADTAMATQMRGLLSKAPAAVRRCLNNQLGRVAARNSCHTGWLVQPSLQFTMPTLPFSGHDISLGDRLQLTLTAENAMGALLRIVGLGNSALGWASGDYPLNPTLLYVDGFDPASRQFHYRVNQDFGYGGRRSTQGANYVAPFQLVIGAKLAIGGPPRDQMARGLGIVPEAGAAPLTQSQVSEKLHGLTADPMGMLLGMRDSLLLTEEQVARLESISSQFRAQIDTLLAPLAEWIAQHDAHMRDSELNSRLSKYQPRIGQCMRQELEQAIGTLTAEQQKRLPAFWLFLTKKGQKGKSC